MHLLNRFSPGIIGMLLIIAFIPSLDANADSTGETSRSPAETLINVLSEMKSYSAAYEQIARGQEQQGKIWLSKPGLFRLEAAAPLSQTIVSDGSALWTFDRDLEQVIVSDFDQASAEIPVLLLVSDPERIADQYSVDALETQNLEMGVVTTYVLTPVTEADASLIESVVVRFADGALIEMAFNTLSGERTLISFSDICNNCALVSTRFVFEVPDGVDLIDDRSIPD